MAKAASTQPQPKAEGKAPAARCCHCGEQCEPGLEDLQGRAQCAPCEEGVFDDWFEGGY